MPAPDIQYFLEGSVSLGHIAPDTYHYFMEVDLETNEIVDRYVPPENANFGRHLDRLADMGRCLENRFTYWRADNPERAKWVSIASLLIWPEIAETHINEITTGTVHDTPDARSIGPVQASEWEPTMRVLRRSLNRITTDLAGVEEDELVRLWTDRERWNFERLRPVLDDFDELMYAENFIKGEKKRARGVVKRSIKFLNSLIGADATRMFVSGDRIRIEGEHCVYELSKTGRMGAQHGGSGLSVFTKGEDLHLCDICIYTQGVPILDHIASIILHIRAGEEDEILKVGNPYNIDPLARDQAWLVPYLPAPREKIPHVIIPDNPFLATYDRSPEADAAREAKSRIWRANMKRVRGPATRFFYDSVDLGSVKPLIDRVARVTHELAY